MNNNQIRIIAGEWKSRKIDFPSIPHLRPTADRIRETVFNWLTPYLHHARCLDLFSGSGIMSFESLSRGAREATCVEYNAQAVQFIQTNALRLNASQLTIVQSNVLSWLEVNPKPYDIIFLDPPYQDHRLSDCFNLLAPWLHQGSIVYFECHPPISLDKLPMDWNVIRQKKAGQINYYLATIT